MNFIVTGGSSGIGREACALLAAAEHQVVLLDRAQPQAQASPRAYVPLDQGDMASVDAAVAAVRGLGLRFDGLLNIAGIPPGTAAPAQVLKVNFLGVRRLSEALLPLLAEGASIVNVASRAGAQWREHLPQVRELLALRDAGQADAFVQAHALDSTRAYNLSKEAVIAWTVAQCEPLIARGVRINAVSPGAVSTAILGDFRAAFGARVDRMIDRVGRPGDPAEVAQVLCFLAQPASRWINGADIPVDGGMGALAAADQLQLGA